MVMSLGIFIQLDGYVPWYVYAIRLLCPLAITSDKHYIYYGVSLFVISLVLKFENCNMKLLYFSTTPQIVDIDWVPIHHL